MFRAVRRALNSAPRWLGHIPRGTQVDPGQFPEDEYPVRCLRCGYDLRRLPDNRCPECGEEFSRGHLLVEQYARCRLPCADRWSGIRRLFMILGVVTLVPAALAVVGPALVLALSPMPTADWLIQHDLRPWWRVLVVLEVIGVLAFLVVAYARVAASPPAHKRRAVQKAARRR